MTKFFAAFEDFFKSIYELFASIVGAFVSVINTIVSTILGFFSGIINLFADVFKGAIDVVGGVGKFIASKSPNHMLNSVSIRCFLVLSQADIPLFLRQHCSHWRRRCRLCHLHALATRKTYCSCEEKQLGAQSTSQAHEEKYLLTRISYGAIATPEKRENGRWPISPARNLAQGYGWEF